MPGYPASNYYVCANNLSVMQRLTLVVWYWRCQKQSGAQQLLQLAASQWCL